jgi:hypothetical protein
MEGKARSIIQTFYVCTRLPIHHLEDSIGDRDGTIVNSANCELPIFFFYFRKTSNKPVRCKLHAALRGTLFRGKGPGPKWKKLRGCTVLCFSAAFFYIFHACVFLRAVVHANPVFPLDPFVLLLYLF